MTTFFPDDDFDESETHDELEEAMDQCGLTDEGHCLSAGSEYCEFLCPFR